MVYFSLYITVQHKAMVWGGTHGLNIFVIHLSYCLYLFLRCRLAQTAQKFGVSLGAKPCHTARPGGQALNHPLVKPSSLPFHQMQSSPSAAERLLKPGRNGSLCHPTQNQLHLIFGVQTVLGAQHRTITSPKHTRCPGTCRRMAGGSWCRWAGGSSCWQHQPGQRRRAALMQLQDTPHLSHYGFSTLFKTKR